MYLYINVYICISLSSIVLDVDKRGYAAQRDLLVSRGLLRVGGLFVSANCRVLKEKSAMKADRRDTFSTKRFLPGSCIRSALNFIQQHVLWVGILRS